MTDLSDLSNRFRAADLTGLPPLSGLHESRTQALWALWVGKDRVGVAMMTPSEISSVLRDAYGISVPRQKIEAVLSTRQAAVVRRKRNGLRAYQLMQAGVEELAAKAAVVIFVDPRQALSKIRETQAVLADLRGDLSVCDPYVGGRTLDLLADCKAATSIRLLTVNIDKHTAFERDVRAFKKEHGDILHVRVATQKVLHDRYIIHDDEMLFSGTSLNGLGLKQSVLVRLGEDLRSTVLRAFDDVWGKASPLWHETVRDGVADGPVRVRAPGPGWPVRSGPVSCHEMTGWALHRLPGVQLGLHPATGRREVLVNVPRAT